MGRGFRPSHLARLDFAHFALPIRQSVFHYSTGKVTGAAFLKCLNLGQVAEGLRHLKEWKSKKFKKAALSILFTSVTAGQLSEMTGLTTGAITHILDRLEKRQIIERLRDTQDDRCRVFVRVNPQNPALLMPRYEAVGNAYVELVDQLSDVELQLICDYMEKASALATGQLAKMSAADRSGSSVLSRPGRADVRTGFRVVGEDKSGKLDHTHFLIIAAPPIWSGICHSFRPLPKSSITVRTCSPKHGRT